LDEEMKVTFSYVNPNGKYDILIHSFHFYLCPQIEIKFKAKKEDEISLINFNQSNKQKRESKTEISKKMNLDKIPLGNIDNLFKNLHSKDATLKLKLPNNLFVNDDHFDNMKVNYSIQIIATLFDYQIKGPIVETDILISSPILNEERFENLNVNENERKSTLFSNDKSYSATDSVMDTLSGMKF